MKQPIIDVSGLKNYLGNHWVHKNVSFKVFPGEIIALIGGSGSGKTTILNSLLLLHQPTEGDIKIAGQSVIGMTELQLNQIRNQMGICFQQSALFSSLSVIDNIKYPMRQKTELPESFIEELAYVKLKLVGLKHSDGQKMPSELSGGMQKRVAAARAIALDPSLLFLDEPVAGLDPKSAKSFDELMLFLRAELSVTVLMVSHDLASIERLADRVLFLGDGTVLSEGTLDEVKSNSHPKVVEYFSMDTSAGLST